MTDNPHAAQRSDPDHEPDYRYQGLVYWHKGNVPGSSAQHRWYADRYYCTKCIETIDRNSRIHGTSYEPVLAGAVPT